jgi:excinuclease ABC subunit A
VKRPPVCTAVSATPDFTPASFSFNSPQGACTECNGLGATTEIDPDLIVPNPALSLREGAVQPWAAQEFRPLCRVSGCLDLAITMWISTPILRSARTFRNALLHGSRDETIPFLLSNANQRRVTYHKTFEGIVPNLETALYGNRLHRIAGRDQTQYMNFSLCSNLQWCKAEQGQPFRQNRRAHDK